jgi:hypothetical protein
MIGGADTTVLAGQAIDQVFLADRASGFQAYQPSRRLAGSPPEKG